MKKKLLPALLLAAALPLSLAACSPAEETKEKTKTEETEIVIREEQPEEVNAITNGPELYSYIEGFIDLQEYNEKWLQIAPMSGIEENTSWFATVKAEDAIDISNTIMSNENWSSIQESAPQTPEEQEAQPETIDEDPLNMSGIIEPGDGRSLSIIAIYDDSTGQEIVQYMFTKVG